MSRFAIIPVKSFSGGKLRLASAINDSRRSALGRALSTHVANTVVESKMKPLIVTDDPEVLSWAATADFQTISDRGSDLNAAVASGVEWATQTQNAWIVVPADLPLLRPDDLAAVAAVTGDVIAPSSDGGTSVLSASNPIDFNYGPASFHRHLPQLHTPTVVVRLGLLHDVDSPADLDSALHHPLGFWLGEFVE